MQHDRFPSQWVDFSDFVRIYGWDRFDFHGRIDEINRFAARFRLAASFTGVTLDGYSAETQQGYSALMKVVLCWSAIEAFMKIMGLDRKALGRMAAAHGVADIATRVAEADSERKFYQFIRAHTTNKLHQRELDLHLSGKTHDVLYLASSIRHIFVHGDLTPNAAGTNPAKTTLICRLLSELCIAIMDHEFSAKIQAGIRDMARER